MVWSSGWGGWFIYFFIIFSFFHVFSHTLRKSSFPNKYKLSFYSYHMCKWHLPPSSVIIRFPLTRGLCLKQKHYAQYLQKTPFLVYLQIKFFFFLVIADLVLVCPHLCSARHQCGSVTDWSLRSLYVWLVLLFMLAYTTFQIRSA